MEQNQTTHTGPHYSAGPSLIPSLVRQQQPDSSPSEMTFLCSLLLANGFLKYEATQISRLRYCTVLQFFQRDTANNLIAPLPLRISVRRYPEEWFDEQFYQKFQAYLLKCVADLDKVAVVRPQIVSQMFVDGGYMLLLVRNGASILTLQGMVRRVRFRGKRMKEPTVSEIQALYYSGKLINPGNLKQIAPPEVKKKKKNRRKKQNKNLEISQKQPEIEELNYEAGYDPGSCKEADSVDTLMHLRYDTQSNRFFHEDETMDSFGNLEQDKATDNFVNFQVAD